MANSTADMRIIHRFIALLAEGFYCHLFFQTQEPSLDEAGKNHIRAGICPLYLWNRAVLADILRPIMGRGNISD